MSIYYGMGSLGIMAMMWIGILISITILIRIIISEKNKDQKSMRGQNGLNKKHQFVTASILQQERINLVMTLILVIFYLFLLTPYVIRVKIEQISQPFDIEYYRNLTNAKVEDPIPAKNESVDPTDANETTTSVTSTTVATTTLLTTSSAGNFTFNSSINVTDVQFSYNNVADRSEPTYHEFLKEYFIPEVKDISPVEIILLWLRFIHFALVPIVIFSLHKDLRKKAEMLVCFCWRPNSVDNRKLMDRPVSAYLYQRREDLKKRKKKYRNVTNFT